MTGGKRSEGNITHVQIIIHVSYNYTIASEPRLLYRLQFTINVIYKSIILNKTKRATTLNLGIQIQDIYSYILA